MTEHNSTFSQGGPTISPSPRATLRVVKHLLEYARDEIRSLGLAEPERLLEAAILAIEDELATTNC